MHYLLRSAMIWALATLVLWASSGRTEQVKQPNIIFLMADDLGWGDVGCFGQKHIQTPIG